MEISPLPASGVAASAPSAPPAAEGGGAFDAALDEQAGLAAARDLLASLPPPVVQQIARRPAGDGAPLAGLGEMLAAVQDGSFVPGERELRAPFWRALDHAAAVFDSPEAMWGAMGRILGSREALATAVAQARQPQPRETGDATAAAYPTGALDLLGGELPAWQLEWWEWTLEFVLTDDGDRP